MNSETKDMQYTKDETSEFGATDGLQALGNGKPACAHNFSGDPVEQWRLTCFATGVDCKKGAEIVDQVFGLKNWFIHEIELPNDRGEYTKAIRTVLIDGAGNAYGFVSQGIYKALELMVSHLGKEPFDPPLPIVVKSRSHGGGRKYYSIEPANEQYIEAE